MRVPCALKLLLLFLLLYSMLLMPTVWCARLYDQATKEMLLLAL
jgi:hypothetical protein